MILVQISASVSGVTVDCMAISETGCQDHGTIKLSNMGHRGPFTLPRYQSAGGPVRSLLPFRVLNAFRLHRGGHKAKVGSGCSTLFGFTEVGIRHKAKVGSGRSMPCGFTEVGISCLLPFAFQGALDDMGDEHEQRQTLNALMTAIDEEPLSPLRRFRQ